MQSEATAVSCVDCDVVAATRGASTQWSALLSWPSGATLFATAFAVGALIVLLLVVIRARKDDQGRHAPSHSRGFTAFLSDTTSAAGFGAQLAPASFPDAAGSGSDDGRAIRIGAHMADLSILAYARIQSAPAAYYSRDARAVRFAALQDRVAAEVAHRLAADAELLPGASPAVPFFRATETEALRGGTLSLLNRQYAAVIVVRYHPQAVVVGDWLECVRVAALRGDRGFFGYSAIADEAERAAVAHGILPATRAGLFRLGRLLRNDPAGHFGSIARQSTDLLAALGN